jgi:hypothetical protein
MLNITGKVRHGQHRTMEFTLAVFLRDGLNILLSAVAESCRPNSKP